MIHWSWFALVACLYVGAILFFNWQHEGDHATLPQEDSKMFDVTVGDRQPSGGGTPENNPSQGGMPGSGKNQDIPSLYKSGMNKPPAGESGEGRKG